MNNIEELQAVTLKPLLWFTFNQNNSGGYFVEDENVCETVCIQAESAAAAIEKAQGFMSNLGSCSCCGDRWSFWVDDSDGAMEPSIYGESIYRSNRGLFRENVRLHYIDGRVETYKLGSHLKQIEN